VLDDPEDKNSKLFVKAKNNLARDTKALRYGMGAIRRMHISSPSEARRITFAVINVTDNV